MQDNPGPFPSVENMHDIMHALLDEYVTDELKPEERKQVENHLRECLQCQQLLREVKQARKSFTDLVVHKHHVGLIGERHKDGRQFILVDDVLREIQAREKGAKNMHYHQKRPFIKWSLYAGIAATFCAIILIVFAINVHNNSRPAKPSASVPPPLYWNPINNDVIKDDNVTFAVKQINISHKEVQFFYALKSTQRVSLQATATVNQTQSVSLSIEDQRFGKLGEYIVGVLHVQRMDREGQVITLLVKTQGNSKVWSLSPLQQLRIDRNPNGGEYISIDQHQLPEITWYGPVMRQNVAFVKDTSNSHTDTTKIARIFLRLDDPVKVKIISQAEYIAIAGKENFS